MGAASDMIGAVLLALAAALAFTCGFSLWKVIDAQLRAKGQVEAISCSEGASQSDSARVRGGMAAGSSSLDRAVIGYMQRLSTAIALDKCRLFAPKALVAASAKGFDASAPLAGVAADVTLEGFCEASVRLAFFGCVIGVLVGSLFSGALAFLLAIAGAVLGYRLPARTLAHRIRSRAAEAERHLPEMLDVVALGMRSGLSFDSSLVLYAKHFDTMLARELANSQRQWSSGLALRDEALRKVAGTYDSVMLGRVVETVIRSVRYGSSMVESLESDAAEARTVYQAKREERVAKAPVKMMVPTGVLILPAMLILVLGPVLLELMEGGL